MATTSNESLIVAYFPNYADAEKAVQDLQKAGFRSNQIGSSYEDYDDTETETAGVGRETDHRSFWEKIRDFFSGESDDRQEQRRDEKSSWDDRDYLVPDRYRDRLTEGGGLISVRAEGRTAEAEQILTRNHGQIDREFATEWQGQDAGAEQETGARRIQLISEVLRVQKERVSRGEVRLRKEVRTETQNIQVPVTREEIVIERTPVTDQRAATSSIGADKDIRVPLSEEQVRVEKIPVVREEVQVGKKPVSRTENVSDQVRHEELKVEGSDEKVRDKSA